MGILPLELQFGTMLKNEGHEVIFIGTEAGLEKDLIPKAGFNIKFIHASGLNAGIMNKIKAISDLRKGINDCLKIIDEEKPSMCIGTGGYVTAPLMIAGNKKKIPTIIHESNALPGKTTRLMCSKIDKVLVGFNETKEKLKNASNVVVTGNPNKMGMNHLSKEEAKKKIGISEKLLLIFGGSQGAKRINEVITNIIKNKQFGNYCVMYATGPKNYDNVVSTLINEIGDDYEIEKNEDDLTLNAKNSPMSFTFTNSQEGRQKDVKTIESVSNNKIIIKRFIYNMEEVMKAADVVVCRSGALTISEISEVGVASILIPFPYAAENHQYYNAQTLENADAGVIIDEKDLTEDILINSIEKIINDDTKIAQMAENSKKIKVGNSPIENIKLELQNILNNN